MPKLWKRAKGSTYYVTINQVQHRLTKDRKESELQAAKLLLANAPKSKDRIDTLLDCFLDWTKRNRSPKTYENYVWVLSEFAKSCGEMKVRDLKPYHVDEWLTQRFGDSSDATKSIAVRTIKRAFNWAAQQGHLESNPIAAMRVKGGRPRDVYIEPEQFELFLKACTTQEIRDLATFLWRTGCRPFEAVNLQRRHLKNGCCVFPPDESKGKKVERVVPLDDITLSLVDRLVKINDPYVFVNSWGRPWTTDAVNTAFDKAEESLSFKITPYALRHSFVTRSLLNGLNPIEVATIVGHADLNMINRVYSKLRKKTDFLRQRVSIANGVGVASDFGPDSDSGIVPTQSVECG
jgi:integrase